MTETQPDPQVVAWMRAWRQRNDVTGGVARPRAIRAWMDAHGYDSFAVSPYDLGDLVAACKAAERALAVADIPAGQGPASLYVDKYGVVRYRATGGRNVVVPAGWVPRDADEVDALNASLTRLAATVPHVTREDAP